MYPAILSPIEDKVGVSAILITTTPTNILAKTSGRTFNLSANVNTTKANSPPPDSKRPVRTLSDNVRPKKGPKAVVMTALKVISPAVSASTVGHSACKIAGSTDAPVVRKNNPKRSPLKGLISASICVLKFDSAKSVPAVNAPKVLDKPKASVSAPVPRATNRHRATKVSEDLVLATTENKYLTIFPPITKIPPNPTIAFKKVAPKRATCADKGIGPEVSIMGSSTSSGTTAMS
mmetsp:Transcript_2518/g.2621  ORF Transcript_2518/g.2621 Transcript_2518/m.2621 type:complete len:234 (-) Transcript_2518:883-1584(-)